MKIKKTLIFNDIHFPHHNKNALSCMLNVMSKISFDTIIANGDIIDCGSVSRHSIKEAPHKFWTDSQFEEALQTEFDPARTFFTLIDTLQPKAHKVYMQGNHEVWLRDWIHQSPRSRKNLSLDKQLQLQEKGYKIYPYGAFYQVGKLEVCHGIYTGSAHAKKHVDMMGQSVLYGHVHDIQTYSKITPKKVTHMAYSNPCLCNLNPDYLRGKPQNWSHGFAIVYTYPNNNFQVDILRIQDDCVVVEGNLITAKKEFVIH